MFFHVGVINVFFLDLLEGQAAQSECKASRSEKAAESSATETEICDPTQKSSVSIAVSTGSILLPLLLLNGLAQRQRLYCESPMLFNTTSAWGSIAFLSLANYAAV